MAPRPIFQVFMPLVKNHWPLRESGMMIHSSYISTVSTFSVPSQSIHPRVIDEEEYQHFWSESDDDFSMGNSH